MARTRRCCCCRRLYVDLSPQQLYCLQIDKVNAVKIFRDAPLRFGAPDILGFDLNTQDTYVEDSVHGQRAIHRFDKDWKTAQIVGTIGATTVAAAGAVDYAGQRVFYVEGTIGVTQTISIRTYAGIDSQILTTTVAAGDTLLFRALAFAKASTRLYFQRLKTPSAGSQEVTIRRIDQDGANETVIYNVTTPGSGIGQTQLSTQMAVDNRHGKLWWAENLRVTSTVITATLLRSDLDGNGVETVWTAAGSGFVNGLQYSHDDDRIYWFFEPLDATGSRRAANTDTQGGLYSANYDLSDQQQVLQRAATDGSTFPFAGTTSMLRFYLGCGLEKTGGAAQA